MSADRESISVTTAGMSGTDDRKLRQRRYLYTQVVRVTCFVLAVALPVALWIKLLLIVAAFVLPMMGVVAANAPTIQRKPTLNAVTRPVEPLRVALEPGRVIDQEP